MSVKVDGSAGCSTNSFNVAAFVKERGFKAGKYSREHSLGNGSVSDYGREDCKTDLLIYRMIMSQVTLLFIETN
jgi:hypothetical protein